MLETKLFLGKCLKHSIEEGVIVELNVNPSYPDPGQTEKIT